MAFIIPPLSPIPRQPDEPQRRRKIHFGQDTVDAVNHVISRGLPEREAEVAFPAVVLMYDHPAPGWNFIRELDPRVDPAKVMLKQGQLLVNFFDSTAAQELSPLLIPPS